MSAIESLVGDAITALRSFGPGVKDLRNLPWVEMELASGRRFELVPTSNDEALEIFGILLRQVDEFEAAQKWPDGPAETKMDLPGLDQLLGARIASIHYERATIGHEPQSLRISL
jgi:hypothetical protein